MVNSIPYSIKTFFTQSVSYFAFKDLFMRGKEGKGGKEGGREGERADLFDN